MNSLVIALLTAYFGCALLTAYPVGRMAHNKRRAYIFRVRWYHKLASTYVLALPVYFLVVYLVSLILEEVSK